MKYLSCLLAVAFTLAAGPSFAETNILARKAQPNVSTRIAQRYCLEGNHQCCCDRAGPLCCPGYECVSNGRVGYCHPINDE